MIRRPLLALTALALLAGSASAQARGPYELTGTVSLGAPEKRDYVVFDSGSQRVFIAHGDHLSVVDARTGKAVGEVTGIPGGTHGTAVSAATGHGFTDDGKAGQAVVFDLKTLKVLDHIPAADDADGMVREPASGNIVIADGDSGQVTIIDPKTNKLVKDITVGGKLEGVTAGANGAVYVEGAEKREVVTINARTGALLSHWAIPACVSPHGIAFDDAGHRLFVSCANALMTVLNTDTGVVVASLPIGKGTDSAAWDPQRKRAFSANGDDGTVSIIQQQGPDAYVALPAIKTAPGARTMAVDPATGRLFVAAPESGSLKLMIFAPL
jgi:YVTN family beta-propeller protein